MEGIVVGGPEVPLLHDVWKVFATEPELEDPLRLSPGSSSRTGRPLLPARPNGRSRMDCSCFTVRSLCHETRTFASGLWSSTTTRGSPDMLAASKCWS
jgi:hypothetical protein